MIFLLLLVLTTFYIGCDGSQDLEKYRAYESFIEVKGGDFLMGINDRDGNNYEYPQRKATVKPFRFRFIIIDIMKNPYLSLILLFLINRIMIYPVTIASFKKFKNIKKGYKTEPEKTGYSWVFKGLINDFNEVKNRKYLRDVIFSN
jgi:formylglycine-generating enzyme required for sulfatase activity